MRVQENTVVRFHGVEFVSLCGSWFSTSGEQVVDAEFHDLLDCRAILTENDRSDVIEMLEDVPDQIKQGIVAMWEACDEQEAV